MTWSLLLWSIGPGLAVVIFRRLITVSWDDVNVYFKRRPSKYARTLERIKALEIECEIRDAAGELVHQPEKPKWPTKGWDAVELDLLADIQRRRVELLEATVGPARVLLPDSLPTEAEIKRKAAYEYLGSIEQKIYKRPTQDLGFG